MGLMESNHKRDQGASWTVRPAEEEEEEDDDSSSNYRGILRLSSLCSQQLAMVLTQN
jgi:hypothetical protein